MPRLSTRDHEGLYAAAQTVVTIHHKIADFLRHGLTLGEIDLFVAKTERDLRCKSCFIGYRIPNHSPFPSHACLSVNHCIVHGTAGYYARPLGPGDVLKIDIGIHYRGYIGDAAWTYLFTDGDEPLAPEVARLREVGKAAIRRGIEQLRPDARLVEFARAVQQCVEHENNLHLIRGYGGHGYGREMHCPPFVSNVVPDSAQDWPDAQTLLKPDMALAVEPMLAAGTSQTLAHPPAWPVFTADGSQSVHYEHDVLVTADGPRVLTEGMEDINDLVKA